MESIKQTLMDLQQNHSALLPNHGKLCTRFYTVTCVLQPEDKPKRKQFVVDILHRMSQDAMFLNRVLVIRQPSMFLAN